MTVLRTAHWRIEKNVSFLVALAFAEGFHKTPLLFKVHSLCPIGYHLSFHVSLLWDSARSCGEEVHVPAEALFREVVNNDQNVYTAGVFVLWPQ
jgi:hypothetical protein